MAKKVPERIGKYKILKLLAQGGMGAVYKGMHPTLERPVILKKLTLRGNPGFVERFRREAQILMDFRNDNIVDVYDHFKEGRTHYIVLEYIDGLSLEELLKRERYLPNETALYILYQVCKGLKYAHMKQVVHRDIKPANILIAKSGDVKLVDFGIATSSEDAESDLTREGMTLGSPAYMAPEQFENSSTVDLRADIYSMGVTLYETVTGKKPFPGGFSASLIAAVRKGKYPPPGKYNPKVSGLIRRIIRKSIKPKRKRRYNDLNDVLDPLHRYFKRRNTEGCHRQLQQAVEGKTVEPAGRRKGTKAGKAVVAVFAVVAALAAAGGALYKLGFYHKWFLRDTTGALSFHVMVDENYKPPGDYYIRGWLFTDTGDDASEIDMEPLRFYPVRTGADTGSGYEFRSRTCYLPEDEYRVKVQIEDSLCWKSFYLKPYARQVRNINTAGGRVLEFHYGEPGPRPLQVDFFVQDRETWEDITDQTKIRVEIEGQLYAWGKEAAAGLETGNVYRFHFQTDGYEPKTFSLLIRPEQSTLSINPRLVPVKK